jgi:hypothetical protein
MMPKQEGPWEAKQRWADSPEERGASPLIPFLYVVDAAFQGFWVSAAIAVPEPVVGCFLR